MLTLGRAGVRLVRWLLGAVLGIAVVVLAGAGAAAWRLSRGPVDVTEVARWLARAEAPDVTLGRVTAALARGDGGRPMLELAVSDAQQPAGPGQAGGSVRSARAVVALTPLLEGTVAIRDLAVDGVRARLVRSAGGGPAEPGGADIQHLLEGLQHLTVADAELEVADGALGRTWRVRDGSAELTRTGPGTLGGRAAATASVGDAALHLDVQGSDGPDGADLRASSVAISPAALARALPGLAPLAALDSAVTLSVHAFFDPDLAPRRLAVHAEAGPGTVQLPAKGGGTSAGRFAAATLDAEGTADAVAVRALRVVLAPPSGDPPSTVVVSGTAKLAAGRFAAAVAIDLDRAALADLPALWPERVGGDSRAWLTENLTAGTVHDGHVAFTMTGTQTGDDLTLTDAAGTLAGEDVTAWWLRPVPPIEHAHAALAWQGPDTLLITMTGGREGRIAAKAGTVRITGLAGRDQMADIAADLAGPLADVVALLRHPRLQLLSRHPIPVDAPSGSINSQLSVHLPLYAKVTIDQIAIRAHGQVADAHLGGIAAGRDLDDGQLALDVTNDGLSVGGTAQLDHLPGKLTLAMDFRAGPPDQVVQQATAAVRITGRDATTAGLGAIGLGAGVVTASVSYAERRDGEATLQLDANLTDAAFATPLGWSKAVGSAGRLGGQVLLSHGKLVGLEGIHAEAPGLQIQARSEVVAGRPAVVRLERGEVGRSSATGTVVLPQRDGEPYRVILAGRQLDLEGRLDGPAMPSAHARPSAPGAPYVVHMRFDRVILGPGRALGPVSLQAAGDGHQLASGHLLIGGATRAEATMQTEAAGRAVRVQAADLGQLLRDADLATEVEGGALTLAGRFDDRLPGGPFDGTMELRGFHVRGAPVVGKVLQGVTLYGLVDALSGPGLSFDRLSTQFRLLGSVLDVKDARAFSSSLGLTAAGRMDFGRQVVDLRGTIVPAYFFNSLPGRMPLLGRLFSPEKGSGVFAANYALRGKLTAPSVSVNPLSALTPGFSRQLFDLFD